MRVLLLQNMVYLPTRAGGSMVNRVILEELAGRQHHCRVVAPSSTLQDAEAREQILDRIAAEGVRGIVSTRAADIFRHNEVEVHSVADSSHLCVEAERQIREFKPSWTLVSCEDPTHMLLEAAIRSCPERVVYLASTPMMLPFGPASFFPSRRATELLRQVAAIVTMGREITEYIRHYGGLESIVIHPPVYGGGPFPNHGSFGEGFITMVNPCAIKGISVFLALAEKLPAYEFAALSGWGTTGVDRQALSRLPNVRMLKRVRDIDEVYSQTCVLLVPSLWWEGFPLVIIEAMLRGIPVLASDFGGVAEAKLGVDYVLPVRPIEPPPFGFKDGDSLDSMVPDQDIDPWLEALRELLSRQSCYEEVSKASRDSASRFVSQQGIENYESFLERLAPRSSIKPNGSMAQAKAAGYDGLPESLSNLSPERRALLAYQLRKRGPAKRNRPTISRVRSDRQAGSFPLSAGQQRLWLFEQIMPGTSIFNLPGSFQISGPLNYSALEMAFREIFARHEILRTTYLLEREEPVQIIGQPPVHVLRVIDLESISGHQRAGEASRLIAEQAQQPFDLTTGPMLEVVLLRLEDREHILILTGHHIVADGWSSSILKNEVRTLYEAFSKGLPSPLAPLPVQYADYACWQRQLLEEAALDAQLNYWKKQLAEMPLDCDLPTDRPRPPVRDFKGAAHSLAFSKAVTAGLKNLSKQQVTLFIIMLAALKAFIHRYTGREDIVVGTGVAGRICPEVEPLIGFFVNTLALRTDLSGRPGFGEVLKRVKEVVLGAYGHQEIPFDRVVEQLQPERDLSRTPLFQVMFLFLNAETEELELHGATTQILPIENSTAKYDLTVSITDEGETLTTTIEYSTDIFDGPTIERMLRHFHTLVEAIVADPNTSLSALPLLTAAERHEILFKWNETESEYESESCIHELFERQAKQHGQSLAVAYERERVSYSELNSRSNQLAHYLMRKGVGAESRVGICVDRGIDMVAGLLGILKAGAAYVPLDPEYPRHRLSYMIDDSGVEVVITQSSLLETIRSEGLDAVCVDREWAEIAGQPTLNPDVRIEPDNLAYVIYTSGSTGLPKGVAVSHKSVARLVCGVDYVELGPQTVILQMGPLAFDASTFEIWGAVLNGGRCVVMGERVAGAQEIGRAIREQEVNTIFITTALFNAVVEEGVEELKGIKQILTGGEAVSERHIRRGAEEIGEVEVVHVYGPTEGTTFTTSYRVEKQGAEAGIPIGRPITNTQVYVLDGEKRPVPVGVAGELYISGAGLARGYINKADQTAERFLPNPFSEEMGSRMYRTGDVCRYRESGEIEYIGRADNQVKIRGHRIEPGEVEAVLERHPSVKQALILVNREGGDKQLVAYIVLGQEYLTSISDLNIYLRERLPSYMAPAAYKILDALPLTPNGKVDLRALSSLRATYPEDDRSTVPPRTPVEDTLASIWSEVLGVDRVGVFDSFFDLGGHSIAAIKIMTKVRQVYQVELSLRSFFESPTIANLTVAIAENQIEQTGIENGFRLLAEVEALSPEEAFGLLNAESGAWPSP